MAPPKTSFGVTLRDDLEKVLPVGDPREESILKAFNAVAGNNVGFPVKPTHARSTPSAPSSSTSRKQRVYQQDHAPLPTSRLRPLKHHGVWDLREESQIRDICVQLDNRKFTYVIVGGGTSGLVLARRLTEDPENKVLVIEAGPLKAHDPNLEIPNLASKVWGSDLDWQYRSAPQEELNQRKISWPRGKVVGGCSTMNIAMINRAASVDYDAWEKLGNEGWNWKELLEYHRRSETFYVPTPALNADPLTGHDPIWSPHAHGHDGPLQVSYSPYCAPQFAGLFNALREDSGLKEIDPNSGAPSGVGYVPASVNPQTETRSSSEAAYLEPIANRKNLMLITNAQATQIVFSDEKSADGLAKAIEVEFVDTQKPEEAYYARFCDEVILCGGSFNSPALLEHSGIGNAHHLEQLNIRSVVDLPGVGENMQDHPVVAMSMRLKKEYHSLDLLSSDPAFKAETMRQYSHLEGPMTQGVPIIAYLKPEKFMSPTEVDHAEQLMRVKEDRYGERLEIAADKGRKKMLEVEKEHYHARGAIEITAMNKFLGGTKFEKGRSYIGMICALQHALSRGHVHIKSGNSLEKPEVDPRFLSHPLDVHHLSLGARYMHKLCTEPTGVMSEFIDLDGEKPPPLTGMDLNGDVNVGGEEGWESWVRNHCSTEHHPASTCSMLPREDNGVVDPTLKVYGTSNVRVADLSIVPLHVGTHTQSTAYMIGEKASDLIINAQLQRRHGY
ncbi:hypothetical protein JCM8547_005500 [Rhodosporidiobolus lusitaniae]